MMQPWFQAPARKAASTMLDAWPPELGALVTTSFLVFLHVGLSLLAVPPACSSCAT